MRVLQVAARFAALAALTCGREPAERPLRVGTTTTVQQSGMLALAESLWTGARLTTVIGPSGQILQAAAQGDLDVVLTHAPALEAKLLAGVSGLERCPFVSSRFTIVGPPDDPARTAAAPTAAAAMGRIAAHAASFVSRGDASGTHERELALWRAAGVVPAGHPWYLESGTGQAATLRIADERRAYALADLPTFGRTPGLALRALFSADSGLINRYTLYLVPVHPPHPAARRFFDWALNAWRLRVLTTLRLPDGTPAFARPGGACATAGGPP
jgi:tungstate transport system substrate-binding protein